MITHYGLNIKLNTVEHGPVTIDRARDIVTDTISRVKPYYEFGEEALKETMVGFSKDDGSLVEIVINSPTEFAFRFETQQFPRQKWLRPFLTRIYTREIDLTNSGDLYAAVESFFTLSTEQYRDYIESVAGRYGKSA